MGAISVTCRKHRAEGLNWQASAHGFMRWVKDTCRFLCFTGIGRSTSALTLWAAHSLENRMRNITPEPDNITDAEQSYRSPVAEMAASLQQSLDPYGMMTSVIQAQAAWLMHPQELSKAIQSLVV